MTQEGIPEYIRVGRKEESWRRVARFRLGKEMKEGRYWKKEEEWKCRLCGWETEGWEHVLERCKRGTNDGVERGIQERVKEILAADGSGEEWMKELEREREGGREKRMGRRMKLRGRREKVEEGRERKEWRNGGESE